MLKSFSLLLCILIISVMSFGLNDLAFAKSICWQEVLSQAIQNSDDLKLSHLDVDIDHAVVKEKRSAYFPSLTMKGNYEYFRDLTQGLTPVSAIGETILPSNTKFQDVIRLVASYTVVDYGIRRRQVFIAKEDVNAKKSTSQQTLRNLKLHVLELYQNALQNSKEFEGQKSILRLYQSLFDLNQRLYQSGQASKLDMAESAIKLAQTVNSIDALKRSLQDNLEQLSYYTKEHYSFEDTTLIDLDDDEHSSSQSFLPESTPEFQMYQSQLKEKKAELEILKKQRWPSVVAYTYYNLYGFDKNNPYTSIQNLNPQGVNYGLVLNYTIFDGFKTSAQIEQTKLQVQHLEIEKDEKVSRVKQLFDSTHEEYAIYQDELAHQADSLLKMQEKAMMLEKLSQAQVVDQAVMLTYLVESMNQHIELEKTRINKLATCKKLLILKGETN